MHKSFQIIFATLILLLLGSQVQGQQDPEYTQYFFNGMALNPAYAGSRDALSANVLVRKQWVQLDGAPATGSFSIHAPTFNEKHGWGGSVVHDQLGITRQTFVSMSYAYRLSLGPGIMSLGLRGGVTNFANRYSQIRTIDPDDDNPGVDVATWLPRVGTGFYYYTNRFYIGLSAPNILAGRYFRYKSDLGMELATRQQVHYFGTIGGAIPLRENLDLRPSLVAKYVQNAPLEFDFNASLLFNKTLWVGLGYRTGDALLFTIEYVSLKGLRIGYGYDYTLTKLGQVNTGTHELMLGIDLGLNVNKIITPRYF